MINNVYTLYSLVIMMTYIPAQASCLYDVKIDPIEIYDGDTIKNISFDMDFDIVVVKTVRLKGIDSPEMNKKDQKAEAIKARDYLRKRVGECTDLKIRTEGVDAFGRSLVVLLCESLSLNDEMIEKGFASVWKR